MKNSKKSFQVLVSKMEPLTENQEGKLKGGFTTFQLPSTSSYSINAKSVCTNECSNTCTNYGICLGS